MNNFDNENNEFETDFLGFSDSISPITNRKKFDTMLAQEIERSKNIISYLSLLMVEIDGFKNLNDTSKNCLYQVALALKSTFKRSGDLAVRWGDTKFICLLTDTDSHGAEEMGKKVRKIVMALDIPLDDSSFTNALTVSVGGVTAILTEDISGDELLKELDHALSCAKESGQNQIVISVK